MKKLFAFIFMMAVCAVMVFAVVSCANKKVGVLDNVTKVSLVENPKTAGAVLAKGCYLGYMILQENPDKYDKEIATIEKLYAELLKAEEADGKPKLGDVNKAAIVVLRAAATAKYGIIYGGAIADATEMAGRIIDMRIKKKTDGMDENAFMDSFTATLKECVANRPTIQKEFEEECVNCDICERIKAELAKPDLTDEERAEWEAMLKEYECE